MELVTSVRGWILERMNVDRLRTLHAAIGECLAEVALRDRETVFGCGRSIGFGLSWRWIPGSNWMSHAQGLKDFLLRGNVIDLAVAGVIGLAFTAVVNAFAESFLTPLINLLGGGGRARRVLHRQRPDIHLGGVPQSSDRLPPTAAAVYFVVVVPVRKIRERRERMGKAGLAEPTQEELLAEIRDLLRAQQGLGGP